MINIPETLNIQGVKPFVTPNSNTNLGYVTSGHSVTSKHLDEWIEEQVNYSNSIRNAIEQTYKQKKEG